MSSEIERVTEGLLALIENGGSVAAAHKQTGIDESTLKRWRTETHAERYRELEVRYAQEAEERIVARMRANAERAAEIESELLERVREAGPRELPQALRAVADSRTKSVDKLLTMTGRPSGITEDRNMAKIVSFLAGQGVLKVRQQEAIDSTAVEEGA